MVIDLCGENQNNWETSNAYNGTPWIWSSVNNFGEKPGLYGKLNRIIEEPQRALQSPQGKYMKGIGIIPEGILNNPLLYDLALNSAWGKTTDTDNLLLDYAKYRYGKENDDVLSGLLSLKKSAYISHTEFQEGCTESLFSARPAKKIESVSGWGTRKLFYDYRIVEDALHSFLKATDTFKNSETFQYDVTDIARQVVANRGQMAYDSLMKAFGEKDVASYNRYKKEFVALLQLQEKLMATNKNFRVGTWIKQAKDFGKTSYEKQLAEKNARMQITFWGPDSNSKTDLHEYAHKEWSGLIQDLYEPRWQLFFEQLDHELAGKPFAAVDFFAMELKWTQQQNEYSTTPKGNYLDVLNEIVAFLNSK